MPPRRPHGVPPRQSRAQGLHTRAVHLEQTLISDQNAHDRPDNRSDQQHLKGLHTGIDFTVDLPAGEALNCCGKDPSGCCDRRERTPPP